MDTPPSLLNTDRLDILPDKFDFLQNGFQFVVELDLVCGRDGAALLDLVDVLRCFLVLAVKCAVLLLVDFAPVLPGPGRWALSCGVVETQQDPRPSLPTNDGGGPAFVRRIPHPCADGWLPGIRYSVRRAGGRALRARVCVELSASAGVIGAGNCDVKHVPWGREPSRGSPV